MSAGTHVNEHACAKFVGRDMFVRLGPASQQVSQRIIISETFWWCEIFNARMRSQVGDGEVGVVARGRKGG